MVKRGLELQARWSVQGSFGPRSAPGSWEALCSLGHMNPQAAALWEAVRALRTYSPTMNRSALVDIGQCGRTRICRGVEGVWRGSWEAMVEAFR